MIDNVFSSSPYLVAHSSASYAPYVNPTQPMSGMVRFNSNRMEVYDGQSWLSISGGSSNIDLSVKAQNIMKWAEEKMTLELRAQELAKTHPGVDDLLDAIAEAEEKLKVFVTLVEQGDNND